MNQDNLNLFKDTLNKESVKIGHPEENLSFALNANIEGFEGNLFRYQTEQGNEECFDLPDGYVPIGKIYIKDNELVIFSTNNLDSEIGLVKNCKYSTLINDRCLNFNTKYPITGQSRIRRGCDRTIYWRDYFNSDRWLNIDEYLRCKVFDCKLLNFNPDVNEPCIELVNVNNQGGSLELGTYSIGVEVLDKNENLVLRSDLSRKVVIYDEFTTDDFANIDGGQNIEIYSPEIGGVPKTNKSITFRISNLDPAFSFLRVFIRKFATGDGITSQSHYIGNLIPINEEEVVFTYTGFNPDNGDFLIDNVTTITPKIIYDRSMTMEQVQNRLLRGNVTEPFIDISAYQRESSKIYTQWVLKPIGQIEQKCITLNGFITRTSVFGGSCDVWIDYVLTYKINGEERIIEDRIETSIKGFAIEKDIYEVEETAICFEDDDVITDIQLDYTCSKESNCNSICSLEANLTNITIDEFADSSKDPNTYWLDSTFMDDEIYAFGIGFEHTNGYKSPIFHIPGVPIDTIITEDGDCVQLTPPEFNVQKCLTLEINTLLSPNCAGEVDYQIKYKVNGVQYISNSIYYTEDSENKTIYLYCGDPEDEITDIELTETSRTINLIGNEICIGEINTNWQIKNKTTFVPGDDLDSKIIEEWNEDLIPFTDLNASQYNALPSSEKLQNWQVYNTARGDMFGRMAYYQCSEAIYQTPDSCCIEDYWGTDYCGNFLEGTPIRHHKFPDKTKVPPGYKLGIRFFNVNYPSDDIVSHFFTVGKRTENNKTVLDQGFAGNLGRNGNRTALSFFSPNLGKTAPGPGFPDCRSTLRLDERYFWYYTPRMLFNKEYINGSYVKYLKLVAPKSSRVRVMDIDKVDPRLSKKTDIFFGNRVNCYGNYSDKPNDEKLHYIINRNYIIDPYSEVQNEDGIITNISHTNKFGFIKTNNVFKLENKSLALISIKVNKDVYCNLESIEYLKMHNCNFTLQDEPYEIFGGDVFNGNLTIANSFLWKVNRNYLKAIAVIAGLVAAGVLFFTGVGTAAAAAIGVKLTATLAAVLGGLSFLGAGANLYKSIQTHYDNFYRGRFRHFLCDRQANDALDRIDQDLSDYVGIMTEFLKDGNVTSEVNVELRHAGLSICNTYPKFGAISKICSAPRETLYNYLRDRLTYYDEDKSEAFALEAFCPEFYGYNKDYSLIYGDKIFFGVPRNYDFCRACTNEFKNTIIWSEKAFDQELKDNYLVYLINNALDVPAHRGPIYNLRHKDNILYVHCKETTFILQPNPQTIKTDKDLIVLGTGDFLALPPQELVQTDVGYGGSQSITAYTNTEHGSVWIDQSKGEILSISKGLEEISQVKMEPWFKEHLPSEFNKVFFDTFNEDYPWSDSISDEYGLGVICVYDPKHERLIVHKKDYVPRLPLVGPIEEETPNVIIYQDGKFYVNELAGVQGEGVPPDLGIILTPISFENKKYFENKSWTISYSLKYKKWISYHSYMPVFMYNDRNFYYTSDNNKLWKHLHNGKHLTYYGIKFPFIVEGIHTTLQTSDLHAFHYISTSEVFNNQSKTFVLNPEITFNNAYFYNTDETSGLLQLVFLDQHSNPYGNVSLSENTKSIIYTNENYKISGIRDVATSSPVTSKNWSDIEGFFGIDNSRHGYIDKVPVNFNHIQSQYNFKELNDKLIIYRLIFNPTNEDVRLSFVLNNNFTFISQR
jgi:hypothetical protein